MRNKPRKIGLKAVAVSQSPQQPGEFVPFFSPLLIDEEQEPRLVRYIEIRRDPVPWDFRDPGEGPYDYAEWDIWFRIQRVGGPVLWTAYVGTFPSLDDAVGYLEKHTTGWTMNGKYLNPSDPDYPSEDVYWTDIDNHNRNLFVLPLPIAGKWEPILDLKEAFPNPEHLEQPKQPEHPE